jgi:hypothetical protein
VVAKYKYGILSRANSSIRYKLKMPIGYITRITNLNNNLIASGTGAYNDAFELVAPVVRVWNLSEAIYGPTTTPSSNALTNGLNKKMFKIILCFELCSIWLLNR